MRTAVAALATRILDHEEATGARKLRRRWSHFLAFETEAERLLCNVASLHIANAEGAPLVMSRRHQDGSGSKTRTRLLDTACRAGLLRMGTKGYTFEGRRFATLWHALPPLLSYLPDGLSLEDLRLDRDAMPRIRIRDDAHKILAVPEAAMPLAVAVNAINATIQTLPLTLTGNAAQAWLSKVSEDNDLMSVQTPQHTALFRAFNGDLSRGGRLYGGWWIQMPKAQRFGRIRLAGEPIAECDFREMFLRLAYWRTGISWPFADGEDAYTAGAGGRDGYKKFSNALLQAKRTLPKGRWPGGARQETRDEIRAHFPTGTKPEDIAGAIKHRHSRLTAAGGFESGLGGHLFRTESDLMVAILLECGARKLPALPVHDCCITPASRAVEAAALMQEIAKRALGVMLPVGITRI